MEKTVFRLDKMDCAAEERLVRMKLDGLPQVKGLDFNLPERKLTVHHDSGLAALEASLLSLRLGEALLSHEEDIEFDEKPSDERSERKILIAAFAINFGFFAAELIAGLLSYSMGLIADSLDMLADALVYGLSLAAVGGTLARKKNVARMSGYFQLLLATLGIVEVLRRFFGSENVPDSLSMILVSCVALGGNVLTLYILSKNKSQEAHMKASKIFTSNDVLVNLLVIVSGIFVYALHSRVPDLVAGGFIFLVVANGARRILAISK